MQSLISDDKHLENNAFINSQPMQFPKNSGDVNSLLCFGNESCGRVLNALNLRNL